MTILPAIDLGFTGTKAGMTIDQSASFIKIARLFTGRFHHGDCIGSDEQAASIVDRLSGYKIVNHPPKNPKYRAFFVAKNSEQDILKEYEYRERDHHIVVDSQFMTATPKGAKEVLRGSGTWLTIRIARAELKPLAIIYPDGSVGYERWPSHLRMPNAC